MEEKVLFYHSDYEDFYDIEEGFDLLDGIKTDEGIIVIADLGLWHGRVTAYKELGTNVRDIVFAIDFDSGYKVVMNNKDVVAERPHHDGINYYTFRVWRKGLSNNKKEEFLYKLYNNEVDLDDLETEIKKYTKSLTPIITKALKKEGVL